MTGERPAQGQVSSRRGYAKVFKESEKGSEGGGVEGVGVTRGDYGADE